MYDSCSSYTSLAVPGWYLPLIRPASSSRQSTYSTQSRAQAAITTALRDNVALGRAGAGDPEIVDALRIFRESYYEHSAARRRALENFAFSALYNALAAPAAMFGLVNPLVAAVAMSGSSLVVTLNALRMSWSGGRR